MIIELSVLPTKGVGKHYKMGFYHFSNNNLAIRKQCAQDLGMYDPEALTSEDVDLCFRLALDSHWVACREPGVVIRHKARRTLRALLRQMWGWGIRLGRPYSKTGYRGFYAYRVSPKTHTIDFDLELGWVPGLACIFLTDFHFTHLLAGAGLVAWLAGSTALGTAFLLAAGFTFWRYLADVRRIGLPLWSTVKLAVIQYAANLAFISASFVGGLRSGMLLIPASILPPRGASEL